MMRRSSHGGRLVKNSELQYGFVGRWLHPGRSTIGALDLGGASTQITFQTSQPLENQENQMKLTLYGQTYTLYTQSFLCYGQDQFLRKLLAHLIQTQGVADQVIHPCYPRQYNVSIKLGEDVFDSPCTKKYRAEDVEPGSQRTLTVVGTGDYQRCANNVTDIFTFSNCSYSVCSFDGVFQPRVTGSFMAFSAFYFTQKYIKQISDITATSPRHLEDAARIICNMTMAQIIKKTNVSEKYMKNICTMTHFVKVLLANGYHFDEASFPLISFEKKAGGASVGWALGYMLNVSNEAPAEPLGRMKALPSGPWGGVTFLFVLVAFFALGYGIMFYRSRKN